MTADATADTTAERCGVNLSDRTTLRVGGPARRLIVATTEQELIESIRDLDAQGEPVLVLGGGSNVLVADEGFDGTVVQVANRGIDGDFASCSGATIAVGAGEPWDPLVAMSIERGWSGLEAMSGIPGLVGATPIQNVGAYGAEVADYIAQVRTFDRQTAKIRTFFPIECGFGYRTSRFKAEPGRHLIVSVTFQLRFGSQSAPIRYAELARRLDVEVGRRAPAAEVRAAVLALRAGKGMVLDPDDPDTWSAGSFFTNPILPADVAAGLPVDAPRFPQRDGSVKTSAAWLIEHAGFGRGFGTGAARLSTKHTLALTNRGEAKAVDLLNLAREIRDGVAREYGIELLPEPVLVGCVL